MGLFGPIVFICLFLVCFYSGKSVCPCRIILKERELIFNVQNQLFLSGSFSRFALQSFLPNHSRKGFSLQSGLERNHYAFKYFFSVRS
jgi:hypothetical protein